MLKRTALKRIARTRLTEARILYRNKKYDGAVHLAGYAVEIGLKRKIIETLNWIDGFPENETEFKGLSSFKVHSLEMLLRLTGQERKLIEKTRLYAKWQILMNWKPEVRYGKIGKTTRLEAYDTINAAEAILVFLKI